MNTDFDQEYPALVGIKGPGIHITYIRPLTEEEILSLEKYTKLATDASQRFKLFKILKRNYEEWEKYTTSLLAPSGNLVQDEMLELDRLLLNFLSAAKSLLDHFKTEWTRKHRKTPQEIKYLDFINTLEQGSWAFAFFQDLRNFTQHCGLPIGKYFRNSSRQSVTLKVECDSAWLVSKYSGWGKSKLTASSGKLDYLDLTHQYYWQLIHNFGNFIAKSFAPDLIDAHIFFASLSDEVIQKNSSLQFRILSNFIKTAENKCTFDFAHPPSDLLGELGIEMQSSVSETEKNL